MLSPSALHELQNYWLPNITDEGLDRLVELLEKDSPLLIHGSFTRSLPMGCLATHAGWHHPRTSHLTHDAGIVWLSRQVGLNPSQSMVIREWDSNSQCSYGIRADLLRLFKEHQQLRRKRKQAVSAKVDAVLVEV